MSILTGLAIQAVFNAAMATQVVFQQPAKRTLVLLIACLQLTGCATVSTLDAAKPSAPLVYAGTRLDLYALQGGCCAPDRFGAEAPAYPALDLPASILLDTLLLPLSLARALGIGLMVRGGG